MSVTIRIDLKEIYELMCDKCRRRFEEYLRKKIAESLAQQILGKVKSDAEGS